MFPAMMSRFAVGRSATGLGRAMMSTTPQTTLAKSAAMGRPMSPDLSIYQPQITSVMSGLYRITSIIFAGTFVLSINYFGLTGAHVQKTVNELKSLDVSPAVWTTAKAAIALPITYHFWNGLRHLMWDTGRGFTMPSVYKTGYAVIGLTFASAVGLAMLPCNKECSKKQVPASLQK